MAQFRGARRVARVVFTARARRVARELQLWAIGTPRPFRALSRPTLGWHAWAARAANLQSWAALDPRRFARGSRGFVAVALLLTIAVWVYPALASPYIYPGYAYAHERSLGQNVYDARGRYLGIFPGALDAEADFGVGLFRVEDHKAVWIDQVPEVWWEVLMALEDAHLDEWRSQGGVDLLALCRVVLWDLPRGRSRGASTITMQVVRSVLHARVGPGEPAGEKIARKLLELRHAPILARQLGRTGVQQWAAMHLPLVIGAPGTGLGSPIYGVDVAGRLLFGHAPDELSAGEQALLAAATWRPVVLAPSGSPNWPVVEARFAILKDRARRGLRIALATNPTALALALRELDRLQPPMPTIDRDLAPLLPKDPLERFRIVANPARRALYFAHGEMVQASYELTARYGQGWRTSVRGIHLSVDAATNRRFKLQVERDLQVLSERRWRGRLALPLTRGRAPATVADVLAVFTDQGGKARLFYQNTAKSIYGGTSWTNSSLPQAGTIDASRQFASLGKGVLAVLLASEGDTPETLLCNAALRGGAGSIHNPGGDAGMASCSAPGALYRTTHAMARSLNLPFLWRAQRIPTGTLADLASDFGVRIPLRLWPGAGLVLGMGLAEPATVQAWFRGIAAAITADDHTSMPAFTILESIDGTSSDRVDWPPKPLRRNPSAGYLRTTQARDYARVVLGAPVRLGGTLEALDDWTNLATRQGGFHIGKSGTATLQDGNVRDLWVAGALTKKGATVSYVVLVGTPLPAQPLGRGLAARELTDIVRSGLSMYFTSGEESR